MTGGEPTDTFDEDALFSRFTEEDDTDSEEPEASEDPSNQTDLSDLSDDDDTDTDDDDDDSDQSDDSDVEQEDAPEGELDAWAADLPPDIQEKIRAKNAAATARIAQLREQREEAKEAAAAAVAEADQIRDQWKKVQDNPIALKPTEKNPLSHVTTLDALAKELADQEAIIEKCLDNPDGMTVKNAAGEDEELTADDIKTIRKAAQAKIKAGTERKAYIEQFHQVAPIAREDFKTCYDGKHPDGAYALSLLRAVPELSTRPDHELIIGQTVLGRNFWSMSHGLKDASGKPQELRKVRIGGVDWVPVKVADKAKPGSSAEGKGTQVKATTAAPAKQAAGGKAPPAKTGPRPIEEYDEDAAFARFAS